jgi:hypothetical protein
VDLAEHADVINAPITTADDGDIDHVRFPEGIQQTARVFEGSMQNGER